MARKKAVKVTDDAPNLDHIEPDLRPLAVPVDSLHYDPKQSQNHDQRSIGEIRRSLFEHGQKKSIVVQREGMIVKAGNGTLAAAHELGWTHLAAVVSDDAEELVRQYAIRDNRTSELSTWNPDVLIGEFEELGLEFEDYGWTETEFTDIVADINIDPLEGAEPPPDPYRNVAFKTAPEGTVPFRFALHRAFISEEVYKKFSDRVDELKNTLPDGAPLEDVLKEMF